MTDQPAIVAPAIIGFIGLGVMGLPMVKCLIKAGYEVQGFDVSQTARDSLEEAGGRPCATAELTAQDADAVITMLPSSAIVNKVVLGPLVDHLGGAVLIDMSSSAPTETRKLGEELDKRGLQMVDAPVSGGVGRAADGSLTIMVGGDAARVARVKPVLAALGKTIFETGPLGSGHAMKALNNFVSATGLTAACEALIVGRKFGLDPDQMVDILNVSTGRNNSTENKIKPFVLSGTYDGGFSLALMAKDLGVAADLADAMGTPSPTAHLMASLWANAREQFQDGADHTEINRYLEALKD
jgi:3-hydroxyisobutyrate dehydrogenase